MDEETHKKVQKMWSLNYIKSGQSLSALDLLCHEKTVILHIFLQFCFTNF